MTKNEYKIFSEMVLQKLGIRLRQQEYARTARIVSERVVKLGNQLIGTYIRFLDTPGSADEWDILIDFLTIPETYFFRDQNQCMAFEKFIIPHILNQKNRIRIWSAGCSTGEEPYTLAIILSETVKNLKYRDVQIIGTDINPRCLKKAKKGIYERHSFRGVRSDIIEKYFIKKSGRMKIDNSIRKMVEFKKFNIKLDKGEFFPLVYNNFDVIFCRNVLIYFEKPAINNITAGFSTSLNDSGYLVLGHSETGHISNRDLRRIRANNAFIFGKNEKIETEKNIYKVAGDSPEKAPFLKNKKTEETKNNDHYNKALLHYFKEEYESAGVEIESIEKKNSAGVKELLLKSLVQVNSGELEKAAVTAEKIKDINEFLPAPYYVLGFIHENRKKYHLAIADYERALFLEPNFFLSYFRLGSLYMKERKKKESVRAFKNALKTIKAEDEEKVKLLSGGFLKKSLEQICRKGIHE